MKKITKKIKYVAVTVALATILIVGGYTSQSVIDPPVPGGVISLDLTR